MTDSPSRATARDLAVIEASQRFAQALAHGDAARHRTQGPRAKDPAGKAYADAEAIWRDLDAIVGSRPVAANDEGFGPARRTGWRWPAAAAVAAVLAAVLSFTLMLAPRSGELLHTPVGGQKLVALEDGSRIALNTATELEVRYDRKRRAIRFDHGEALFEVAHDAGRPFVVTVGGYDVVALGTSFSVRSDEHASWVTLVDGSVRIERNGRQAAILRPGERLALDSKRLSVDHPQLDTLMAWRQGKLILDETLLSDAVLEINRYTARPIRLGDPALGRKRLSGTFRVRGTEDFASSVAVLYGLRLVRTPNALVLQPAS